MEYECVFSHLASFTAARFFQNFLMLAAVQRCAPSSQRVDDLITKKGKRQKCRSVCPGRKKNSCKAMCFFYRTRRWNCLDRGRASGEFYDQRGRRFVSCPIIVETWREVCCGTSERPTRERVVFSVVRAYKRTGSSVR